jgi:hypothetical protein
MMKMLFLRFLAHLSSAASYTPKYLLLLEWLLLLTPELCGDMLRS